MEVNRSTVVPGEDGVNVTLCGLVEPLVLLNTPLPDIILQAA